jgi:hypothetical protein
MTHPCPGPECPAEVDPAMLMCPQHWHQVPKPIRAAVWRTWKRGAGAGTPAHRAAIRLAVSALGRDVVPASSLDHPACGSAVESLPQAGPVSPIRTGGTHR